MRRRTPKTAKVQKRHAKIRFIQRVGIGLDDELYDKIIKRIRNNKYELAEKQSNRVSIWRVPLEGREGLKDYYVVYDRNRNALVTVLTKEMFGEGQLD